MKNAFYDNSDCNNNKIKCVILCKKPEFSHLCHHFFARCVWYLRQLMCHLASVSADKSLSSDVTLEP